MRSREAAVSPPPISYDGAVEGSAVADSAAVYAVIASCRSDLSSSAFEPGIFEDPAESFQVASEHGLSGLFYRQALSGGQLSSQQIETFRPAVLVEAGRSYRMADELLELQALFREQSIEMVAFKGPVIASRAYPRISDRAGGDLDILIRPSDFARAADLLTRSGYIVRPEDEALLGLLNRTNQYHASFIRSSGTVVELHWALNAIQDGTMLDTEGMLQRAQAVPVLGAPVMSMTVEDTLLHLCVHGFRHRWSLLKWLADVAYLLRGTEPIDWITLEREARQVGCHRILVFGLGLTHNILGAPLPEPILRSIRNDRIARKLIAVHRQAILEDRPLSHLEDIRCEINARERLREHAKASWAVLSRIFRLSTEDLPHDASIWMKTKAVLGRPGRLYQRYGWKWVRDLFVVH